VEAPPLGIPEAPLMGLYRPTYRDKVTKEVKECAVWYARYLTESWRSTGIERDPQKLF
jgi:hypothetical protein